MSSIFYQVISIISIINDNVLKALYVLNSDVRRDIFIGVTGLMVAIIIFIAEVISNKKYELEKRVILSKTDIIKNMKFCIFIYFIMYLSSIIKCSYDIPIDNKYFENDTLFIIMQSILNILIIAFMYRTYKIFKTSVKLNIDKEYFNKELDNYVYKRCVEIEKEASKKSLKNIKQLKQEFDKFIENNNKISTDAIKISFVEESYIPIHANSRGTIKNYNYKKILSILDSIDNISNEESKEFLPDNTPVFVFTKKIGDRIEKNTIIGYCLKGYKNYFKDFSNCIIYDVNSMYIDDEIKLINDNMFKLANTFSEPDAFDNNNKLFNYFNYLYENDLNGVRKFSINQLEKMARIVYKDKYKNYRYSIFLNSILSLAYSYENFEDYHEINGLIYFLYYQQFGIEGNDEKKIAYNFANHYFKYDYFSIKNNSDIRFYDELMANLLKFICLLIKDKKFDVLTILFKNILLEFDRSIGDDFNEKDILNFQFSIGIIECLVMLVEKNEINDEIKSGVEKIINWSKQHFIHTYDAWQTIIIFKKYYNRITSIQKVYDDLEFTFIDHKYFSSWGGWSINEKNILKELLYSFNITVVYKDSVNYNDITKDDKYYYKDLLKLLSSTEKTKFEKILGINFSNDSIIKILNLVITDSENKEIEYIKNNKLNDNKINKFKEIIKTEISKSNVLEDYLKSLNKIEKCNIKIKRVCGINQLIPRNIFFEDYGGYESIAKQFGEIFKPAKEKEFISIIESISNLLESNIEDYLSQIANIENYLLITNYINYDTIKGYDIHTNSIIINGKRLEVLKIPQIKNIYLIEKEFLPKLQYCEFDDDFNKKNIENNLYYELNDCSKENELRNRIINESSWLSEKGNVEEQNEYLKQQCRLRVFLAFRFNKIKNSKAIKFNTNNE